MEENTDTMPAGKESIMSPRSLTRHRDSSAPLKAAWTTSWKATARGTDSAVERVRGEGPRLLEILGWRVGGSWGGGWEGGGSDGGVGGGWEGGESGRGRRGPALGCCLTSLSRLGEELPVLSLRWTERAVLCRREAGVGLGVPRSLPSGRALLGGRGREMRELATFSLWALLGRVLTGSEGGLGSATLKLGESGQPKLVLAAGGGWLGRAGTGDGSGTESFSELRLLMSDSRSDTSLLSWLAALLSSLDSVFSPGSPGESKLASLAKRPSRSWL